MLLSLQSLRRVEDRYLVRFPGQDCTNLSTLPPRSSGWILQENLEDRRGRASYQGMGTNAQYPDELVSVDAHFLRVFFGGSTVHVFKCNHVLAQAIPLARSDLTTIHDQCVRGGLYLKNCSDKLKIPTGARNTVNQHSDENFT